MSPRLSFVREQLGEERGVVKDDAVGDQSAALRPEVLLVFGPKAQLSMCTSNNDADKSLARARPIFCIRTSGPAQYVVYVHRICSIFPEAMPYKDLPCIGNPRRSRLSPAKSTSVRYCRPSKAMSITSPCADS